MAIGYLVNVYPKVSHAFIRREILALERAGVQIFRYTIRSTDEALVDVDDIAEAAKTHVILEQKAALFAAAFVALLLHPLRFLAAARAAWRFYLASRTSLIKHVAYLLEAAYLVRRSLADGVHHLHVHFGTNPAVVAVLCRMLGGPTFSMTIHGCDEFDAPEALCIGEKVAAADFTVAISSFTRSQLMRWADPKHWPRIHVIRCGIDSAFRDVQLTAPSGTSFTCIGRFSTQKGHHILLHALHHLRSLGHAPALTLIGDGPLRESLEALAAELNLTSQVTFTGNQSAAQIRSYLEGSRATVLPSFAEGLPVVIMESLALARPVVTTYIAGIPELILNGENGWLVPAGSITALAHAMAECLALPDTDLEKIAMAGAASVRAQHDIDSEAARLAELFRNHQLALASITLGKPILERAEARPG